jgi:hypothetical protein
MQETFWLALGAFSMILTLGWLFVERRITTTAILAGAGWSYMALTADSLTKITQDGTEVATTAGSLGYFCTGLALLSFLALLLRFFGHYPPEDDDPTNAGGMSA